jgi:carboxyl-terminal processing protease
VTVESIEADVAEALTMIEGNHVKGKNLDYNDLFKPRSIRCCTRSIRIRIISTLRSSSSFAPTKFEIFRHRRDDRRFVRRKRQHQATFIKATFDGAPANRAGLRYGDKIVEVNGVDARKSYIEVRNFLRGPRGTIAKLTVERYGTGNAKRSKSYAMPSRSLNRRSI